MKIVSATLMACVLLALSVHFVRVKGDSEEQVLKTTQQPANTSSDIVTVDTESGNGPRSEKQVDDCGLGRHCSNGTYCCHNGGCCPHGWSCCSLTHCCAGAAGLAGSTLGHTMVILCCIAGYFIAKQDKHILM
ncbi:hypothetical protein MAR_037162 [Mya arenaria]|uniref:Uncharacterized protein n=1 Tax=Mya arenaria TaxID=6604 RepID=A0ABY7FMQ5_MYAAR|nr:uncharacterized protein LOC128212828 [Mya arenaria]WAR23493.1 hypothetical protein MAR_037162 [Mya arenaria]